MNLAFNQLKTEIVYPGSDGQPMAESDSARDYLIYGVEALDIYFQDRDDIYVSGNLFIAVPNLVKYILKANNLVPQDLGIPQ